MNNLLSHTDLLHHFEAEISNTFNEVGGIIPALSELYDSHNWRYCQTVDKKARSKIGYICEFGYHGNKPFIKITVNSFRHGGERATFNSLAYKVNAGIRVRRTIPRTQLEQNNKTRDANDAKKRQHRFLSHLRDWKKGDSNVFSHPYVINKGIVNANNLRQVGESVSFPITNLEGDPCGIQLIFNNGDKRIYGQKKGGYALLGDLQNATCVYFCEGYATGNAIYEIARLKKSAIAVVICLDCHNLTLVTRRMREKYPHLPFVICPDNDKKTFDKGHGNPGLLAGLAACIASRASIKIPTPCDGSDWCDAWLSDAEDAAILFHQKTHYSLQELALLKLRASPCKPNTLPLKKAIYQTFKFMIGDFPIKQSEDDILNKVLYATSHTQTLSRDIINIWRRVKKRRFALALRAKSFSLKQDDESERSNIHVIACASIDEMQKRITSLKREHPKAVFATNAPMGSGKTQHIMRPEFALAESQVLLPLVITPVRSLTKGVSERFYAHHYIADKKVLCDKESLPASLAITINSIINPLFKDFLKHTRALFIDEYTQVLRAITMGTVDNAMRQTTEKQLARLVEQAHYTYVADADLHQIAVDHLRDITPRDVPLFIFTLEQKAIDAGRAGALARDESPIQYRCHQYNAARLAAFGLSQTIIESIKADEKVYIATDSKAFIDKLHLLLGELNKKVLDITSDTVHFDGPQAFLAHPDNYLRRKKPDVVIVSPAVQSGVSIETDYFDKAFGVYTGTVTPVVFQQMLHRLRTQRIFDIVLPELQASGAVSLTNPTALLMAAYQQHINQFGDKTTRFDATTGITHIGHIQLTENNGRLTIAGDDAMRRFETLSASLIALENQQHQLSAQFLILQAWARAIDVSFIKHTLDKHEKEQLKNSKATLTSAATDKRQQALSGENRMTEQDFKTLQKQGAKTSSEVNEMARYTIANQLNTSIVTCDDVAFYDEGGVKAITNFHLYKKGQYHADALDTKDKKAGVAKTGAQWRKTKVALLDALFEHLGIDATTGEGVWEKTAARQLRETIRQSDALIRFIQFKLKLNITSSLSDVAFANKLISKLLKLNIKRVMVREGDERHWMYYLEEKSFMRLMHYYDQAYASKSTHIEVVCHQ